MKEYLAKRRKGYNFNFIIGIACVWFIPFGPFLLIQSIRYKKMTDKELYERFKKIEDKKAARAGKTVKYTNIP